MKLIASIEVDHGWICHVCGIYRNQKKMLHVMPPDCPHCGESMNRCVLITQKVTYEHEDIIDGQS